MRKVVQTSEVAHLWAHERQEEARNQGHNFYFYGSVIYSYGSHFPIAQHYKVAGKHLILFTTQTYSNTTNKHLGEVRGAIPYNIEVVHVPYVEGVTPGRVGESYHRKNIRHLVEGLLDLMGSQRRARKHNYLGNMEATLQNIERYVDYFSCKSIAKRMTGKERRSGRKLYWGSEYFLRSDEARDLLAKILNKEDVLEEYREIAAKIRQQETIRNEQQVIKNQKSINKWRAGETPVGAISHIAYKMNGDILRVAEVEGQKEIQTSKGIRLPYNESRKAFMLVERVHKYDKKEVRFTPNEFKIGAWNVDKITSDGDVRAGCHFIRYEEAKRIAEQENW